LFALPYMNIQSYNDAYVEPHGLVKRDMAYKQ